MTARRLEDAYREHRSIFDAAAGHDSESAERLARTHLANTKEVVPTVTTLDGLGNAAVQD
jgi:DNA-binding GntR family transcriptional regulator